MSSYLLDTSALLTLRDNEPGAARVSQILINRGPSGGRALLWLFYVAHGSVLSGMER